MTVQQVSRSLRVSKQRVHQLIKEGKLGSQKIGGTVLVRTETVRRRIEEMGKRNES